MIRLYKYHDLGILLLRMVLGVIFILHGAMKFGMWSMEPSEQLSATMLTIFKILSICEPLGGLALIIGFLTPIASIGLSIIMLGALYFKILIYHVEFMSKVRTGWEFDLLILSGLICLIFSDPGRFSIDRFIFKNSLRS